MYEKLTVEFAMVLWKQLKQVNFVVPEELLAAVDAAANENWMSRSQYIRSVLDKTTYKYQARNLEKLHGKMMPKEFLDVSDS